MVEEGDLSNIFESSILDCEEEIRGFVGLEGRICYGWC